MASRPSLALVVTALGLAACTQPPQSTQHAARIADQKSSGPIPVAYVPTPSSKASDPDFVSKASAGDAFEIAAAQAALQHASNPDVKRFAATMVRDHTQSAADLKEALATSGRDLTATSGLSAEQQQALSDLSKATPQDFDKTYVSGQVKAHQAALALLQDYAQNGDTPALKAFASLTAPVVQDHYEAAKQLQSSMQ